MLKKLLLPLAIVWTAGFVMGNAFWYLASPLWIDREVSETLSGADRLEMLAAGRFVDADAAHRGSGTATLYRDPTGGRLVALSDFQVTNGPDLKVYLVEKADIASATDVLDSNWVSLGVLKGNIGDQNYQLPDDLAFEPGSVVIWCEQFSVLFSAAPLS